MIVDFAPSNRAVCKGCGDKIRKGTKRGTKEISSQFGMISHYYCKGCFLEVLAEEEVKIEKLRRDIKCKLK